MRRLLELASAQMPVVLMPSRCDSEICIGFRERDIAAFHKLLEACFSLPVSCFSDRGVLQDLASFRGVLRALESRHLVFRPVGGDKGGASLRVSLYRDKGGLFDTRDRDNVFAKHLYKSTVGDRFDSAGFLDFEQDIGLPHESFVQFPIDVVYTWVNHEDPDWRKLVAEYHDQDNYCTDRMGFSRFFNRDEIRFSLRSLMLYMPWVAHIHVVSNCSPPDWLDLSSDRISWVEHGEIIPEAYLPTFNSRCIETYLHHIPELSEHFIYMNDDVFVNKHQGPAAFFLSNGIGLSNMEPYGSVLGEASKDDPDFVNGARNAAKLMSQRFGVLATQRHKHAPVALRRSVLEEIEGEFAAALAVNRRNKFRGFDDASFTSFLYHHYAYQTSRAIFVDLPSELLRSSSRKRDSKLNVLVESSDICFFCLNDDLTSDQDRVWDRRVKEFLEHRFIAPCEFEATNVSVST